MIAVLEAVRRTIRRHDLARSDTRVVVALSGGSDSMALAHLLRELDRAGELRVVGVAHFNHGLRPAADRDEAFSRAAADALGWPTLVDRADVRARARDGRQSVEHAARIARHRFFDRAREHFGADVVALGHTRDDQAETFLLRVLRGAGPTGLAAMHPRNGAIIRPLIACRRTDLRAYLDGAGVAYVEDETNADVTIPRNRIRAELLPLLERRFNPSIVDVLADEAELAREQWDLMRSLVTSHEPQAARLAPPLAGHEQRPASCELDIPGLRAAHAALRRAIVWRAMSDAACGRPVLFRHVQAALDLLEAGSDVAIDGPGQRVQRIGSRLVLTGRPAGATGRPAAAGPANLFRYPLSIPGEVVVPEAGCIVTAEMPPADTAREAVGATVRTGTTAAVRRDLCRGQWAVRNRRPGDRFRPAGLGGRKKLQDYFVDLKVARGTRDAVPLVVDDRDRIVWVAGYGIDEAFRVTDPTQAVLILRLRQA